MKNSLERLFRLRSLLEEVSLVELEVRLHELSKVEKRIDLLREGMKTNRRVSFAAFQRAESRDRVQVETMTEWMTLEREKLAPLRTACQDEVRQAQAVFLERRKESKQVEGVMEAREDAKALLAERRVQKSLDDWYGQQIRRPRKLS